MADEADHTAMAGAVTWLTSRRALAICALLLVLFGGLSFGGAWGKSATYDEVVHAPAGYSYLREFDFRANPEHPPLWKYWAASPWFVGARPSLATDSPEWAGIREDIMNQWTWGQRVLYHTPGNDADGLLRRSRFMMMLLGVGCGAMLAWWAYRLAGPAGAVVVCGLYALDPNFLGHASLVTNDVAFTLVALALSYVLWQGGRRLTAWRALGIAVLCGVAVTTKFTGLLAAPVIGLTLLARAALPAGWDVLGRTIDSRWRRTLVALAVCAVTGVVTYGWVWLAYGARWRMAPDPAVHLNFDQMVAETAYNETLARTGGSATPAQLHEWRPSAYARVMMDAIRRRWLPDAFVNGVWYAYFRSLFRWGYLLGERRGTGWWYYFPFAVLVKAPVATLAAWVASAVAMRWVVTRRAAWTAACLVVPVLVYGMAAMRSHMNIGVRHVFPVYAFGLLAAAVVLGRLARWRPKVGWTAIAVMGMGLAAESLAAWPDDIAFFNVAAGGSRGGLRLLSDSNLDWGQDLPLVARWQRAHPDRPLHLAYFGTADPAYYHIRADLLLRENGLVIPDGPLPGGGVIAVSATTLQGLWQKPGHPNPYAPLLAREPVAVLGGTIYVYDLDRP